MLALPGLSSFILTVVVKIVIMLEAVYAHAPGQSQGALSTKHKLWLTTGPDLLLNAFPLVNRPLLPATIDTTVAPAECRPHSTSCSDCVATNGDIVVSGSGAGEVVVLRLPDLQFERVAMQFGLAVRAVAVSSGGRFIAAAGDECEVKVVDGMVSQKTFKGHTARVVAVAISEKAPIVASFAKNGEVYLWTIIGEDDRHFQKYKVGKADHEWNCAITFSKDGNHLAVPDGHGVVIFDDKLVVVKKLEDGLSPVIGCTFSNDYLFAYRTSGIVDVYSGESFDHLTTLTVCNCAILSLAVSEDQKTIYTVDEEGNARSGSINITIDKKSTVEAGKKQPIIESVQETASDTSVDDNQTLSNRDSEDDVEMVNEKHNIVPHQFVPFHPNNTPFDEDNSRYLAWNAIGKVIARRDPISGTTCIDVDFADTRHHRPIRFTDDYELGMAFLDDHGCVFASEHTLLYMPTCSTNSWAIKVNTVLEVGDEEKIVSVACNQHHIFCLSNEYLRVMSTSGCQLQIICIPGNPLCITTNPECAVIIYSEGESIKSMLVDQQLNLHDTMAVTKHQPVWCGPSMSDDCDLIGLLDCVGNFHVLSPNSHLNDNDGSYKWLLLHRQPKDHTCTLWPIFFTTKHIHAVLLHDGCTKPDILPVPLVTEVPFKVPLLRNPFESTIERLTNSLFVDQLLAPHSKDKNQTAADKITLELIQIAIKMDHHQRALHLYEMLFLTKSRDLAVQLARHARATALVERMTATSISAAKMAIEDDGPVDDHHTEQHAEPKPKKRLYLPDDDTQMTTMYSQDPTSQPSQERVNPFAKRQSVGATVGENGNADYVNVLERLSH